VEVAAYVCSHVFNDERPVLLVSHAGGDWQFLCGNAHNPNELPKVVGLNHLFERDNSLDELLNLPIDWEAERSIVGGEWKKKPVSDPDG
jgi:hypothetical protein